MGESENQPPGSTIDELHALIEQLEREPNEEVREKALSAIQLVIELYGDGLRHVMAVAQSSAKDELLPRLLESELLRALLLIHGLMPVELYDRVAGALDSLRDFLLSQGCQIELLGIDDGTARLRLIRSGRQAAPLEFLRAEIEKALIAAAPDLSSVSIEGLDDAIAEPASTPELGSRPSALVQIRRTLPKQEIAGPWIPVIRAHSLEDGQFKIVKFKDVEVLVCRIGEEFCAYRNACAAEHRPLDDALYEFPMITCSCHGYHYDVRRGNCMEHPELKLQHLPVKVEEERVKVAIQSAR